MAMDLIGTQIRCKNYLCWFRTKEPEFPNCFHCKHMLDWPCPKRSIYSSADKKAYQSFIDYIRKHEEEAREAYKKIDALYDDEVERYQEALEQSDPASYFNHMIRNNRNPQQITSAKQLQELIENAKPERFLRAWRFILYTMPGPARDIDDKLASLAKCNRYVAMETDHRYIANCFTCRLLFSDNRGLGCSCWFNSNHSYKDHAEKAISIMSVNPICAFLYLAALDVIHAGEKQRWDEFQEQVFMKIQPTPSALPKMIKEFKEAEQQTPDRQYRKLLRDFRKIYKKQLSDYEMQQYAAAQRANRPTVTVEQYEATLKRQQELLHQACVYEFCIKPFL